MGYHKEASQTSTNSDVEIEGVRVYTEGSHRPTALAYRFEETDGSNGVDVKVQGSIDGTNWLDLTMLDETGSDHAAATVTVAASGSDQMFLVPVADNNATAALQEVQSVLAQYRVIITSALADNHGVLKAHVFVRD